MPALAEINLETLQPPGEPGEFVVLEDRPVFKEHVNRAGQKIGERELKQITQRCNDRISETGDFAPLVVGHTTDDGSYRPEVIGFAGPYRMGKVGQKHPMPAILGKLWVYKEKADLLKKYPRLSVEYWADEQDPGNGYFDPISLLGAETPELDLGIRYSKDDSGRRLMRYSRTVERFQAAASYPGGSNTFVPALAGGKSDARDEDSDDDGDSPVMQQYEKEPASMATLTPEDIQQIVAAMKPIVTQQISEAMAGMKAMDPEGDGDGLGDADGLDLDGDSDLDVGDDLDGLDDLDADAEGDGIDIDPDGDDADLSDDDDLPSDIDDEYSADDGDFDLDDDSGDSDTELSGGNVADSDDDDSDPFPEASGQDEEEDSMPDKPDDKKKPAKFAKQPAAEMTREQYAKENRVLRERYEKQVVELRQTKDELDALKSRVGAIEGDKRKAVRYSKLNEIRSQGYVLDVDQELADSEPLNDDQFARHCTKIVERYARAPIGAGLYVPPSEQRDGVPRDEKRERYSKLAQSVTLELRGKGKKADYAEVLANIERNDGKYVAVA